MAERLRTQLKIETYELQEQNKNYYKNYLSINDNHEYAKGVFHLDLNVSCVCNYCSNP